MTAKVKLTNPEISLFEKTVCEEFKLDRACIGSFSFKDTVLDNSAKIARLKSANDVVVKLVSNMDRQKKLRGQCNNCDCEEYMRPEFKNDCDRCLHGAISHIRK
jgi:hypothetical protein